jgi:hypothetical protein
MASGYTPEHDMAIVPPPWHSKYPFGIIRF